MKGLRSALGAVRAGCEELEGCAELRALLGTILEAGNFLNEVSAPPPLRPPPPSPLPPPPVALPLPPSPSPAALPPPQAALCPACL